MKSKEISSTIKTTTALATKAITTVSPAKALTSTPPSTTIITSKTIHHILAYSTTAIQPKLMSSSETTAM